MTNTQPNKQSNNARKIKWIAFIAVDIALAVALFLLFSTRQQLNLHQDLNDLGATIYPQQIEVADNFSLLTHYGETFTAEHFRGRWTLLFFGFTNCPNICPLSMVELGQFYRAFEAEASSRIEKPLVAMVTVDPEQDDPITLADYVDNYHEDFLGLTGRPDQIRALAQQLYVVIDEIEEEPDMQSAGHGDHSSADSVEASSDAAHDTHGQTSSGFDHSGHISVISPDGKLHAVFRLPHRDQNINEAYRLIVENWN